MANVERTEVYLDRALRWRYRHRAANGRPREPSAPYGRRFTAVRGAHRRHPTIPTFVQDRTGQLERIELPDGRRLTPEQWAARARPAPATTIGGA